MLEPAIEPDAFRFKSLWEYRRTNTPRSTSIHYSTVPVDDYFHDSRFELSDYTEIEYFHRTTLIDQESREVFQIECNHYDDIVEVFRVEKDLRPLTAIEIKQHSKEVEAAMTKELQSWIDNSTGRPVKRSEYTNRTGLKPIPSRWFIDWKMKEGSKIRKARLCLKGFAEMSQKSMHTFSPTASRVSLRLLSFIAAQNAWELWSLDVSTAFLQGYTFEQLNTEGIMKRQPCAFNVDQTTMNMLARLSPKFKNATDIATWCIELLKGAYGLKDAPLLWNLKLVAVLVDELRLIRSSHGGCVSYFVVSGELVLVISLHVDDTFVTGRRKHFERIHRELEKRFGKVKCERNNFKHFGIMVNRSVLGDVTLDQTFYLDLLKPVTIKSVVSGRRVSDSPADAEECNSMRSLIGGMSWMSMTSR